MSFRFLAWAQSYKTGAPSTKAVLMALCSICNDDGVCWPSQQRIADDCELSLSTVKRSMADLETAGMLSRERRYREGGYRTSDVICVHQEPEILGVTMEREKISSVTMTNLRCHHDLAEPVSEPVNIINTKARGKKSKDLPFPESFVLNDVNQALTFSLGYASLEVQDQIERMRDWAVNAGRKGLKSDWQAFARNWFKSDFEKTKKGKHHGTNQIRHKPNSIAGSLEIVDAQFDAAIARATEREAAISAEYHETDPEPLPRLRQVHP